MDGKEGRMEDRANERKDEKSNVRTYKWRFVEIEKYVHFLKIVIQ